MNWLIGSLFLVIFSGCFDTVEEVTINDNGSGTYISTLDMGKILGMAKSFGGDNKELKDLEKTRIDTLVNLKEFRDSIKNLSGAEKKMLETGTLRIKMDAKEELFSLAFSFPFSKPAEIAEIKKLLGKTKNDILEDRMKDLMSSDDEKAKGLFDGKDMGGDPEGMDVSIDGYYTMAYEKNKIVRKLNKEKAAHIEDDKSLKSLQEMGQMGFATNVKTIINLPKPAKKAEGKGVKLSEDKKKVTIEGTLDDFFEDPAYYEYEIEY
jgi:hypothetical protein